MFQQQAESEGVQPNHSNNMPNSISEEPINRLPSYLGGSANQLQLFYMPNSSSEKPIHQLPSNIRERPQQPQLSEAQIAHNEFCKYQNHTMFQEEEEAEAESEGVQPNVSPSSQSNTSSEEPNHQLPSNLGGSAHQSDQFFPKSEIELDISLSGVVRPNVNRGGSAHKPQLSESRIATDDRTAELLNYYRPLYNAAQSGDWKAAISFIECDPNALIAWITALGKRTVFHAAAFCWQWEFILKLLELTSPESIAMQDECGRTVLHIVAHGGSLKTAKALVQKNFDLLQMVNNLGDLPLFYSIFSKNKELIWYLSLITRVDSPSHPFFIPSLPRILQNLILSGYYDVALYFVQKYPHLALARDADNGESLLYWLTINPSSFFSGSNLGFLERWIYKFVHVELRNSQPHLVMVNMEDIPESILEGFPTLQPRSFATQVLRWFKRLLWKTIAQLVPYVKKVRDAKLKHECAVELVNHVCTQLSSMSFQEIMQFLQNRDRIMASAVTGGIEEIVRTLFLHFPDLIDICLMPNRNILQVAIEYRQVEIVNLLKKIFPTATMFMSTDRMESQNTTLHLAGELAPPFKLLSVSGVALQMQRELQWFKEVEEIEFPDLWDLKNENNEIPIDVFRRAHKELAKEGEKWMKDTANSCMLVSALIATVLFAAAFTVPGGNTNDDKGIPIFLRTNAFTIFAISDALGLFSSLTSLLMFLSIITARYAIEDFLESLPKKLIIGLGSLFFSIVAMIIAFGAALTIVLSERWHWVFVPITLLASFPVAIFVMLQLPLFVQMVQSTYGASMFRPWPSRKFE